MVRFSRISFFLILLLFGCKKTELSTVKNNTPPPDPTIENVSIENYINRTYILVLGREPDSLEFETARQDLSAAGVDSISRQAFLNTVFSDPDYLPKLYDQNRIDFLNNTDTSDFSTWIAVFQFYLQDTSYQILWPVLQYEIDRLLLVRDAYPEFTSGTITIEELHRRMCNNYVYDQINMGSANFVISSFQHLLNRNPTLAEQQSGINMVEGNNSIILLQAGSSKNDYLNILTQSDNYFEGQVVLLYQKFLQRDPVTQEMTAGKDLFKNSGDYTAVQKRILASNEFIGIQ